MSAWIVFSSCNLKFCQLSAETAKFRVVSDEISSFMTPTNMAKIIKVVLVCLS